LANRRKGGGSRALLTSIPHAAHPVGSRPEFSLGATACRRISTGALRLQAAVTVRDASHLSITTTISCARPRVGDRLRGRSDDARRQVAELASGSSHSLTVIGDRASLGRLADFSSYGRHRGCSNHGLLGALTRAPAPALNAERQRSGRCQGQDVVGREPDHLRGADFCVCAIRRADFKGPLFVVTMLACRRVAFMSQLCPSPGPMCSSTESIKSVSLNGFARWGIHHWPLVGPCDARSR
jgi:hypothetical protein